MAKFTCRCGEVLYDQTDYIPYKAHVIADQDISDVADQIEAGSDSAFGSMLHWSTDLFQCNECSRLIIFSRDKMHFFSAEDPDTSKQLTHSIQGEGWKRHLRGRWINGAGEVWWGFGVEDQAFVADIATWDELHQRYYEAFERLRSKDILRGAMLTRDGNREHVWPPEPG